MASVNRNVKRLSAATQSTVVNLYLREAGGVLLSALVIFFALSLISYSPTDTTFFYYQSDLCLIKNWCGALGADIASWLVQLFGSAAYVLLFFLALPAYLLILGSERIRFGLVLLLLPVAVTAGAALTNIYALDITRSMVAGGVVGEAVSRVSLGLLGFYGSIVLLWSALWVSVVLALKVSPARACIALIRCLPRASTVAQLMGSGWRACVGVLYRRKKERPQYEPASSLGVPQSEPLIEAEPVAQQAVDEAAVPQEEVTAINFDEKESITLAMRRSARAQGLVPAKGLQSLRINSVLTKNFLSTEYAALLQEASALAGGQAYALPGEEIFGPTSKASVPTIDQAALERGAMLEQKLLHFGIKGVVTSIKPGPLITLFEYQPEIDSKLSKITALEDDLAMALQALSIRIIAPIPGRNAVGFEISNQTREAVLFAHIAAAPAFASTAMKLPMVLGVDVLGAPVICDLTSMPHLLLGGTTGSGKSVGLNGLLVSLLCKKTPDELRLILIDPKRLEFAVYADIPHLLFPIVTNPVKASLVLKWVVQEMEERYSMMSRFGVRNMVDYLQLRAKQPRDKEGNPLPAMPFIAVVIDELADLMMVAGKEVETYIVRIAQMARAAGIHMIVATQRPSVDVVTGIIKVNFPSRIAYRVSSKVDSRTILDQSGAEKLLGKGDLLFMHSASQNVMRVHGAYVTDQEIEQLAAYIKCQREPQYLDLQEALDTVSSCERSEKDELYKQVLEYLKAVDEISISSLQRQYRIGFNRSARIIEQLELDGYLAPAQGSKPRKVIRS